MCLLLKSTYLSLLASVRGLAQETGSVLSLDRARVLIKGGSGLARREGHEREWLPAPSTTNDEKTVSSAFRDLS